MLCLVTATTRHGKRADRTFRALLRPLQARVQRRASALWHGLDSVSERSERVLSKNQQYGLRTWTVADVSLGTRLEPTTVDHQHVAPFTCACTAQSQGSRRDDTVLSAKKLR